jgi:L-ascorbate metabolism protein UlaG (beta-lactamase superfamily)
MSLALIRVAALALVLSACAIPAAPAAEIDAGIFQVPRKNAITFWGHASFYIDVDGFGIAIDPVFDDHAFIRWRHKPKPPAFCYAGTRLILITHAHTDHLSLDTIGGFPPEAVILCPGPSERYVSTLGREVISMAPGEEYVFPGGKVVAVMAKHAGTKFGIRSRTDGGAMGYVLYTQYCTVYFSGDTNLFEGIYEVGKKHAPDIAVLNITGHLHGEDAVEAARGLGSEIVIPCHFGAYGYLFVPERDEPRDYDDLVEGLGDRVVLLRLGESHPLARPER